MSLQTPVLFLIFNRPDLTRRVFEQIREAQPSQLFIAADGPRADQAGELELCRQTRAIFHEVDWNCQVKTLFREQNLGCKMAVSSAINWFFQHVEDGIILEDDCLPHPTFFPFCTELLERYRHDKRIMVISGDNFQAETWRCKHSYYFSIYNHIWGWASWRRAWQHYDGTLSHWPDLRDSSLLKNLHRNASAVNYWQTIFDKSYAGQIDSWDYPWTYSCWVQKGLTILPRRNLVSNIGFDERATHTRNHQTKIRDHAPQPIEFPLQHPSRTVLNRRADQYTTFYHFGVSLSDPLWRRILLKICRSLNHIRTIANFR